MDCKTARQLLDFARSPVPELEESAEGELKAHLADCSECGSLARAERMVDEHIGRVVQAVPVPAHLRARLLAGLEADGAGRFRRQFRQVALVLGTAAAIFFAIWFGWDWQNKPARIDLEQAGWDVLGKITNPLPDNIEEWFRGRNIITVAPTDINYRLLAYYGVDDFQGKRVPLLLFTEGKNHAWLYILSDKQFDLKEAMANPPVIASGAKVEMRLDPSRHFGYLIIYTGEQPLDLFPKNKQPSSI